MEAVVDVDRHAGDRAGDGGQRLVRPTLPFEAVGGDGDDLLDALPLTATQRWAGHRLIGLLPASEVTSVLMLFYLEGGRNPTNPLDPGMMHCALCTLPVPHGKTVPKPSQRRPASAVTLNTILAGFRFITSEKVVLGAISLDLFVVLLGGAVALMPVFTCSSRYQTSELWNVSGTNSFIMFLI